MQKVALKKAKNFNYEVKETLATLSNTETETTELRIVSYNNYKPKLDLHKWEIKDNKEKMLRGLTLTNEEAIRLLEALQKYFKKPKED